ATSWRHRRDGRWRRSPQASPRRWRATARAFVGAGRLRGWRPAGSWLRAFRLRCAAIDQIERENLAVERGQTALPGRHVALPSAPDGGIDRVRIAAVDPRGIGEVRRSKLGVALAVLAMAGHAIIGEDRLAGLDPRHGHALDSVGARERADIGDHRLDIAGVEHLVAAERHHLRTAGL